MTSDSNRPIGIFDSGLGGLSVAATVHTLLPNESIIYYGDSLNAPYGEKTKEEVTALCFNVCNRLIEKGAKAIVVACNTATSAAIGQMRKRYDIPIIGMEPALKPAVEQTETGTVAVLATELTLREIKFRKLMDLYAADREILAIPCPRLVRIVEDGCISGKDAEKIIVECLGDASKRPLEAVVLGCTHYVFLKPLFYKLLGSQVSILDGNEGTAKQLKRMLKSKNCLSQSTGLGLIEIENSAGTEWIHRSWALIKQYKGGCL